MVLLILTVALISVFEIMQMRRKKKKEIIVFGFYLLYPCRLICFSPLEAAWFIMSLN